jgi:RimJ/RimL family protein N-acetyltransferase
MVKHPTADLQPTLTGATLLLRPLRVDDWDALYALASDPLVWELHPAPNRYQEPVFRDYFSGALASGGALAAIDRETAAMIGSSRFANYEPLRNEIEIGWTFLARSHWGGSYNREMKALMMTHAFQHFDSVRFNIGASNSRSRRAIEKIGARLDGEYLPSPSENVPAVPHVIYRMDRDDAAKASMLLGGSEHGREQARA